MIGAIKFLNGSVISVFREREACDSNLISRNSNNLKNRNEIEMYIYMCVCACACITVLRLFAHTIFATPRHFRRALGDVRRKFRAHLNRSTFF